MLRINAKKEVSITIDPNSIDQNDLDSLLEGSLPESVRNQINAEFSRAAFSGGSFDFEVIDNDGQRAVRYEDDY